MIYITSIKFIAKLAYTLRFKEESKYLYFTIVCDIYFWNPNEMKTALILSDKRKLCLNYFIFADEVK